MKVGCPNCGGNIKFVPEKQLCVCDNCKSEIQIKDIKYNECNYDNYKCSSCGGILISDETTLITICPYCNSHQLVKTKYDGVFKPNKIVPFKFGNKDFYDLLNKYICSNRFSPDNLLNDITFNEIKGIYVPFKKYNLDIFSHNRGKAIDKCYYNEQKIKYLYKNFVYDFKLYADIVFDVSSNIKNDYTKSLGPFDLDTAVDYNPAYLCNFTAQLGDDKSEKDILVDEIHKLSDAYLDKKINLKENGESTLGFYFNGGVKEISYEIKDECNILLPIWFVQYTYKSEKFICVMNGQNGKIIGKTPISLSKYLSNSFFYFLVFIILFSVILFILFAVFCYNSTMYESTLTILYFPPLIFLVSSIALIIYFSMYFSMKNDEKLSNTNLTNKCIIDLIKYKRYDTDKEYYSEYNNDDLYSIDTTIKNLESVCYHNNVNNYYSLKKNRRYKYVNYDD